MSVKTENQTEKNSTPKTEEKGTLKNNMRTSEVAITLSLNTQSINPKTITKALQVEVKGDDGVNMMTCLEDVCRFEKISALEFKSNPILTMQRNLFTNVINLLTQLEEISTGASQSLLEQRGINKTKNVKHGAKGGTISLAR
jgi:hypothetical protein